MALSSGALDFNNHFLNQIIYHSIQNDRFLQKIRHIVPLDIFKTRDKEYLIKIVFNYFDEFGTAPHDNFYDIFKEHEKVMGDDLYERCINLVGVLKDITGSNADYILSRINDGIMHFRLEEASVEFATLIKRGKYDEAKSVILKAMKNPDLDEPYYNFFKDKTWLTDRLNRERYKMITKIDLLDAIIGGYRSGWLINILGATKGGKTWFLIDTAISAVLQGLNVLFISLEMGKEQIDERFDMAIGFMTSNEHKTEIDTMKKVGNDWQIVREEVDTIYNVDKVIKNRERLKRISGGDLKIVAFDRGRMNYRDIERVINELEETQGFYTDVAVIDYLGIMKETHEGQNKKERISENSIGLKELAGMKKIVVVSGMQGNRNAMKASVFHSYLVADDIDSIFNSDLVLALCQTDYEEKMNKARLYIANFRHGKQHIQIGLYRDLAIGQVALDTFDVTETVEQPQEQQAGVDY